MEWSKKKQGVDPKRAESFSKGFINRNTNASNQERNDYKELLKRKEKEHKPNFSHFSNR